MLTAFLKLRTLSLKSLLIVDEMYSYRKSGKSTSFSDHSFAKKFSKRNSLSLGFTKTLMNYIDETYVSGNENCQTPSSTGSDSGPTSSAGVQGISSIPSSTDSVKESSSTAGMHKLDISLESISSTDLEYTACQADQGTEQTEMYDPSSPTGSGLDLNLEDHELLIHVPDLSVEELMYSKEF